MPVIVRYSEDEIVAAWKRWYSELESSPPEETWEDFTPEQQAEHFISLLKDVQNTTA